MTPDQEAGILATAAERQWLDYALVRRRIPEMTPLQADDALRALEAAGKLVRCNGSASRWKLPKPDRSPKTAFSAADLRRLKDWRQP